MPDVQKEKVAMKPKYCIVVSETNYTDYIALDQVGNVLKNYSDGLGYFPLVFDTLEAAQRVAGSYNSDNWKYEGVLLGRKECKRFREKR